MIYMSTPREYCNLPRAFVRNSEVIKKIGRVSNGRELQQQLS